ncbi:M48 family metallopeptidase [Kaarinaea lacus]
MHAKNGAFNSFVLNIPDVLMNTFTTLFLAMLALSLATQLWLTFRHINHIKHHKDRVPDSFKGKISLADHQKAAAYTLEKSQLGMVDLVFSTLILLGWTLGGGLAWIDQVWQSMGLGNLSTGVAVLVSTFFVISLLDIPFSLYSTFVIEEKYGFNKSTIKIFISDFTKQSILTVLLGVPLAFVVLWLMESSGSLWWIYVWVFWTAFTLFLMWLYPVWIAPLFNKFSPLDNSELVQRINNLLKRCGFSSNGIFVMDGSKRSGHGNAYFTGVGAQKRIVFFDTLLDSLNADEIEAVLAHELGHFKHKHVVKRMVTMAGTSLVSLALLGWLMQQSWFYTGLGVTIPSTHMALLLFLLVIPVFGFFLQPVSSFLMRKHEFEADTYAAKQTNALHLIQALVKLYSENANTLTPDPLFSAFHDSHPPAPVRIAFLSSKLSEKPAEEPI